MTRTRRLMWTGTVVASAVAALVALTYAGQEGRGPLNDVLSWARAGLGRIESTLARQVSNPERRTDLGWLEPYRNDPERLRAPEHVLLGAYDGGLPSSMEGVAEIEAAIDTRLPLLHVYAAWGERPEHEFPERIVEGIWRMGSIPVVTWEPWLTGFENTEHPHLRLRDVRHRKGLRDIAAGDYDFYIDAWAEAAAEYGHPLMLRFAHEMNDPYRYPWGPQNQNEPEEFIAAWRHVVERFRAIGADNVIWVWSPHVARQNVWGYYPGDAYVDWLATGVLNYGTVARWSKWWSVEELFTKRYEELQKVGKPIMVAEFGSLAIGGDRAAWYREALDRLPERFPQVYSVIFFHTAGDSTVTRQPLDWTFVHDPAIARAIRTAIAQWAPPQNPTGNTAPSRARVPE